MLVYARVRAHLTYSRSINFLFHDNERKKQTSSVMPGRMLDVLSSNLLFVNLPLTVRYAGFYLASLTVIVFSARLQLKKNLYMKDEIGFIAVKGRSERAAGQ